MVEAAKPEGWVDFCPKPLPRKVVLRRYCGRPGSPFFDRDCLGERTREELPFAMCNAYAWVAPHAARYIEFWDETDTKRLFRLSWKADGNALADKCHKRQAAWRAKQFGEFQIGPGEDPYTINIPGINDFIKAPGIEDPELKKQRARRFYNSNSALPSFLSWVPTLLNKLDDAQDLLWTGLMIARPLIKLIGPRLLGPLGLLLTLNDMLNMFA